MKTITLILIIIVPFGSYGQQDKDNKKNKQEHSIGLGLKAGLNFSNITNAGAINGSNHTGFHAGVLYAPTSKLFGSRTELMYSRQGYDYSFDSTKGTVKHDYIVLVQLMTINITRFVQIQLGSQFGYLLNAKADSSKSTSTGNATTDKILSYYNRFDYGLAGGLEIHPIAGLLIGARYNISFSNLYKKPASDSQSNGYPSFASGFNLKNNLVQVFAGYRF
jgi:hypothetical protein